MSAVSGKTDKNGRALPEYPGMRLALRLAEEGRRGPALDSDAPPALNASPSSTAEGSRGTARSRLCGLR